MDSCKVMCAKVSAQNDQLQVKASCSYIIDQAKIFATKTFGYLAKRFFFFSVFASTIPDQEDANEPRSFRHLSMVLDNSQNEFHDMHENKMSFIDFVRTNPHLAPLTKDIDPAAFFCIDNMRRVSNKDPRHLSFMHSPSEGSSPIRFAFDFFLKNINLRFPTEEEISKGKAFGLHFFDSWSQQEPSIGFDNFDCITRL